MTAGLGKGFMEEVPAEKNLDRGREGWRMGGGTVEAERVPGWWVAKGSCESGVPSGDY